MALKQLIILALVIAGLFVVGNRAFKEYRKFNPPSSAVQYVPPEPEEEEEPAVNPGESTVDHDVPGNSTRSNTPGFGM